MTMLTRTRCPLPYIRRSVHLQVLRSAVECAVRAAAVGGSSPAVLAPCDVLASHRVSSLSLRQQVVGPNLPTQHKSTSTRQRSDRSDRSEANEERSRALSGGASVVNHWPRGTRIKPLSSTKFWRHVPPSQGMTRQPTRVTIYPYINLLYY